MTNEEILNYIKKKRPELKIVNSHGEITVIEKTTGYIICQTHKEKCCFYEKYYFDFNCICICCRNDKVFYGKTLFELEKEIDRIEKDLSDAQKDRYSYRKEKLIKKIDSL